MYVVSEHYSSLSKIPTIVINKMPFLQGIEITQIVSTLEELTVWYKELEKQLLQYHITHPLGKYRVPLPTQEAGPDSQYFRYYDVGKGFMAKESKQINLFLWGWAYATT